MEVGVGVWEFGKVREWCVDVVNGFLMVGKWNVIYKCKLKVVFGFQVRLFSVLDEHYILKHVGAGFGVSHSPGGVG